jgi:hypothetical protein
MPGTLSFLDGSGRNQNPPENGFTTRPRSQSSGSRFGYDRSKNTPPWRTLHVLPVRYTRVSHKRPLQVCERSLGSSCNDDLSFNITYAAAVRNTSDTSMRHCCRCRRMDARSFIAGYALLRGAGLVIRERPSLSAEQQSAPIGDVESAHGSFRFARGHLSFPRSLRKVGKF